MESVPTLIIVPVRVCGEDDLEPLLQTLVSLSTTAPGAPVLVADAQSPAPFGGLVEAAASELGFAYGRHDGSTSTVAAINGGLEAAVELGADACLVAPGLVFRRLGWLERLCARTGRDGAPAAVSGGAIVGPRGLVLHAGHFFSMLRRTWHSRLRNVPEELLDVDDPVLCPVSDRLQLVRRDWIERAGGYDEELDRPYAGLDFCLRVAAAGGDCVYEPGVRAAWPVAEGDVPPDSDDAQRLAAKHADMNFATWVPEVL